MLNVLIGVGIGVGVMVIVLVLAVWSTDDCGPRF